MINVVDTKALGIIDPMGTKLTLDYKPGNNTKTARYRVHKNKLILYISNTLINQFFMKGDEKEHCAKRVFETYMTGNYWSKSTAAMDKGSYFETKSIGGGAGGSKVLSLPLGRGGKLSVDQQRIDGQVAKFKMLVDEYKIVLSDDDSNIQVKGMTRFIQNDWLDVEVFVTGEADFISPIDNYKGRKFGNTVIDLKLTKDMTSTFGPFAWGNLEFINTQQATIYHLVFDLPFAYWLFDYKPKGPENKLIFVNHDVNHPNAAIANKAKYRLSSTKEVIRKTVNEIAHNFIKGWEANPKSELCRGCPVENCLERNRMEEI